MILRFILAVMILIVLMRTSQDNAYIGFSLWIFMSVSFMIYTINSVDCEDIKKERKLLKTAHGRRQYYHRINSR
jgi:hypothetical protein